MTEPLTEPLFPPETQGSTREVGEAIDDGKGRIFPCDQCGADLEFSIGQQRLKCPFCGHEKEIERDDAWELVEHDYLEMLARLEELRTQDGDDLVATGTHEVRCSSCGANVIFQGTLTSSACPYCSSPLQRDQVHDAHTRIPVDGVLPFTISREEAAGRLKKWVQSLWFAPNDFKKQGVEGRFQGCYFPYFTYDSATYTRYAGQRGDHYYVTVKVGNTTRTEQRTRWTSVSGDFQRVFDDVLVLVVKDEHAGLLQELEPWPLGRCRRFTPELLAGLFARTYDISLEDGFGKAKERIEAALYQDVCRRIGGDVQRVSSRKTSHSAITFKHLLLPAWLLAYRYRQKTYRMTMNAATGEVHGERPYSWIKITLFALFWVAVAGGVWALTQK